MQKKLLELALPNAWSISSTSCTLEGDKPTCSGLGDRGGVEVVSESVKETIISQCNKMFDIWRVEPTAKDKMAELQHAKGKHKKWIFLRNFTLTPRCKWDLRFSGKLIYAA
jgi:hypothetical protein